MGSPPRNSLFYRPLLTDVHDIVTQWEQNWSHWRRREVVLTVVLICAIPAGCGVIVWMSARMEQPQYAPRYASSPAAVVSALESQGAHVGRDPSGRMTWLVAHSPAFDDADLVLLAGLPDLQAILLVECPVTDAGVMTLRTLPRLRSVRLIDTEVTAAGNRSLQVAMPQTRVRVDRTSSASD